MRFADKLKELREAKGLTQKGLADLAKTTQQNVARWETGENIPSFDFVQVICMALGVRCTVFDGCTHEPVEDKRGRGRPVKKDEPAKKKTR